MVKLDKKLKDETTRIKIRVEDTSCRVEKQKSPSPKKVHGEDEIAKYCQDLKSCFDVEGIVEHFG